jgi:Spy/CpxP family protein refolding chaperone
MRPAMVHWWKHGRPGSHRGAYAGCGHVQSEERPTYEAGEEFQAAFSGGAFGGGSFGVRRPLRFLAFRLGLDETQVAELAKILDQLKTERAQAAVDDRRALTAFAEAVEGEAFDEEKSRSAVSLRVKSAETLQQAVSRAVSRMHAVLNPDQRAKLAHLIRTGALLL